jgi:hypothetical protein
MGLRDALLALFPDLHIDMVPTAAELQSTLHGPFPCRGFTHVRLRPGDVPDTALELVQRAAIWALGDERAERPAADLVVILDDLELTNRDQEAVVVDVMRAAAAKHLAGLRNADTRQRTADALAAKVSFHLAAPMIESWFFADTRLARTPDQVNCTGYNEAVGGVEALRALPWTRILRRSPEQLAFLNALLLDIADMAGVSPQHLENRVPSPLTHHQTSTGVLRNL